MMRKYCSSAFIYMIFATIATVYITTMKFVCLDLFEASLERTLFMSIFTVSTILMVACLLKTMFTDPGKVPQNWGFFLNDPEQKKRRFCLICHIFKPERCHHCSACNRCVLNMDHHCPWINNCVGFQNRKFFLQMLLYVIITTVIGGIGLFAGLCKEFENIYALIMGTPSSSKVSILQAALIIGCLVVCCLVTVLISMFLKFHLELVLGNRTTIENLERKRQEETGQPSTDVSPFDIGRNYNWLQVFGNNRLLWFLPISSESGSPCGDGILWPKRNQPTKTEEISSPHFTSPKTNDNSQQPIQILDGFNQPQSSGSGNREYYSQKPQLQNQYGFVGGQLNLNHKFEQTTNQRAF